MKYDFDQLNDRRNDHSFKYQASRLKEDPKLIPMWVADMDFKTPPFVQEALMKKVEEGIFGYTSPWEEYYQTVCDWMKRRHNMDIRPEWIAPVCGVVPGLRLLIQAFTKPDEAIMIFSPVYYPFKACIEDAGRICIPCRLNDEDGHYSIDFKEAERLIEKHHVKAVIFCSPHNPIGRVWTKEEMDQLAELVSKYDLLLISDEIHMDFDRTGHFESFINHPLIKSENLIVCTAPSKTFNLAGLDVSNLIIPDPDMKERYARTCELYGMGTPNLMGLIACQAAYSQGDEWVDQLNEYLKSNIELIKERLSKELPSVKVIDCEGLYLVWMDFTAYGLDEKELEKRMLEKAHLWLDEGYIFGGGGQGFERMNIAAPRATISQAMNQLVEGFKELEK